MAEYCHNSCSKCPPFARIDAQRRPCHLTRQLHCQWWSGQCHAKDAENAASVRNTCLDHQGNKMKSSAIYKEYLTGTGNWNNKYVSKLSALKLDVLKN